MYSLLKLVKSRLQHVLKTLVKVCVSKPSPGKDAAKLAEQYKASYKATFELSDDLDCDNLIRKLHKALSEITTLKNKFEI